MPALNIREMKNELLKEYQYRIETHAHTFPASTCSEVSAEEVITAYSQMGYDGLVITNHFMKDYNYMQGVSVSEGIQAYLNDYYEAKELGERMGLTVLLGTEIRFTENANDYLIYGVDETMLREIYGYLEDGVENFRKNYKMPKSVFLQAHPFRDGMVEIDPALLDGLETFNLHPGHNARLAVAAMYAKDHDMGIQIAGSDFHFLRGRCLSVSAVLTRKMPKDSFEFAEILKSHDYLLEIGKNAVLMV